MTSISEEQNDGLRLWIIGLVSGASAALLPAVAAVVVYFAVSWRRIDRLTFAGFVRIAAGFLLAMILCNLLKNWPDFQAGFIEGVRAASK